MAIPKCLEEPLAFVARRLQPFPLGPTSHSIEVDERRGLGQEPVKLFFEKRDVLRSGANERFNMFVL